jgi:hypothetical protein
MDDTERGYLIAEYMKYILMGCDMILLDPKNLKWFKEQLALENTKVSKGYAFPLGNYSKVDALAANVKMLEAIVKVIEARKEYKDFEPEEDMTEKVLSLLGIT